MMRRRVLLDMVGAYVKGEVRKITAVCWCFIDQLVGHVLECSCTVHLHISCCVVVD